MPRETLLASRQMASSEGHAGLWTARVEDIDDPKRMGRVRVRVFAFHNDKDATPTIVLPWAEVTSIGGGSYDSGSGGQPYPVGSNVWVMFEMGKSDFPIVMGGRRGQKRIADEINSGQSLTVDGQCPSGADSSWVPAEDNELSKEIFSNSYVKDNHPTRTIWHKSYKGHTILVEERDGFEFLRIIDRSGQVIEMDCPVTVAENANNSEQRGARNAVDDNQLSQDLLVNGRGYIRLKDIAGQEIILDGKSNNEEIRIISRNRFGSSQQKIILSSSKGSEKIEIIDKQNNRICLDPNAPASITIEDWAGNKIEFDSETGVFRTNASAKADDVVASDKTQSIGGKKEVVIGGDDKLKVAGNKFLDIMNDLSASIAGMTSIIATGPINASISNSTFPSGLPATNAMSVEATAGNIDLNAKTGEVSIGNLAEKITVKSTAVELCSSPTGFVALATLVLTELQKIITVFNNHGHNTTATIAASPTPGFISAPTPVALGIPPTSVTMSNPSSVASAINKSK